MKRPVILASFGGPESLDGVEPFLREMFSDPRILDVPGRRIFAALIARTRARRVAPKYAAMGGGSPMVSTTLTLARRLRAELSARNRDGAVCAGFLYAPPFLTDVTRSLATSPDKPLVIPLFPQESRFGYQAVCDRVGDMAFDVVRDFSTEPAFVDVMAKAVQHEIAGLAERRAHILFTAHSIPLRAARSGDPYVDRVEHCARAISKALPPDVSWTIAYQSRIGPVRWVGPSLVEALDALPRDVDDLVVVPLSFIGENLETLVDLDRVFRAQVTTQRPSVTMRRVPVPSLQPAFVAFLANLVCQYDGGNSVRSTTEGDSSCSMQSS